MKFLANFDSEQGKRIYDEAVSKFGKENVLFVHRNAIYLALKFIRPAVVRIIRCLLLFVIMYHSSWIQGTLGDVVLLLLWTGLLSVTIYFFWYIGRKLTDYYMDFVIVTPNHILVYDQDGLLNRMTISIETDKIKSINVKTNGLIGSIFNFGSIVFLTEGDAEYGEMALNYITKPVKLRNQIQEIIGDEPIKAE